MKHASEQDRRDWHQAINEHNAGVERARKEYERAPIGTYSHPVTKGCVCADCSERREISRQKKRRKRIEAAKKQREAS